MIFAHVKLYTTLLSEYKTELQEAINAVNSSLYTSRDPVSKILVASTLRKRVRYLCYLTWTEIASHDDPERHKKSFDPSVLHAASEIAKKRGLDFSVLVKSMETASPSRVRSNPPAAFPAIGAVAPSAATLLQSKIEGGNEKEKGAQHNASCSDQNPSSQTLLNSLAEVASSRFAEQYNKKVKYNFVEKALPLSLPALPPVVARHFPGQISEIFTKGATEFLSPQEVYRILTEATILQLPVSVTPPWNPSPGSMYLYSKAKTRNFRNDGYVWKKRETHAKRKIGSQFLLNCCYVGGIDDGVVQRRCYWLLEENASDLVLVHYLPPMTVKSSQGESAKVPDENKMEEPLMITPDMDEERRTGNTNVV